MTGEAIVCFAKDWDDDPTSNTHVMRLLARRRPVVWLNSVAMRTPQLGSGRDLGRIGRRLASAFAGPVQVAENLWVVSPLVLPFPHNRAARTINRALLRATVALLRRRLGFRDFQLWTFLPTTGDYVGTLGERLVVYYCVDRWLHAAGMDGTRLAAMERDLCARADLVFATSHGLVDALRPLNPETHLALHGVDYDHFATALAPSTPIASEVAALPPPVLGFVGYVDERVDLALLAAVARRRPDWTLAIVGRTAVDTRSLAALPNVRFLGRQPYARLPELLRGCAVGLIPFVVDDYTLHVNPIKLREYLSAGVPVVSTPLPEVARYADLCTTAEGPQAFVAGIEAALAADSPARRAARSAAMRAETWESKVAAIEAQVERVRRTKER